MVPGWKGLEMRRPRLRVLFGIGVPVLLVALGAAAIEHKQFYTCEQCGAVATVTSHPLWPSNETTWRRQGPGFTECVHRLRQGADVGAHSEKIADGQLVLVRRGQAYGGLIIDYHEAAGASKAGYRWWYREDGSGDLAGAGALSGAGTCSLHDGIEFGPFKFGWSCGTEGSALYFGNLLGGSRIDRALGICATDLGSVAGVDAAAANWRYAVCTD